MDMKGQWAGRGTYIRGARRAKGEEEEKSRGREKWNGRINKTGDGPREKRMISQIVADGQKYITLKTYIVMRTQMKVHSRKDEREGCMPVSSQQRCSIVTARQRRVCHSWALLGHAHVSLMTG